MSKTNLKIVKDCQTGDNVEVVCEFLSNGSTYLMCRVPEEPNAVFCIPVSRVSQVLETEDEQHKELMGACMNLVKIAYERLLDMIEKEDGVVSSVTDNPVHQWEVELDELRTKSMYKKYEKEIDESLDWIKAKKILLSKKDYFEKLGRPGIGMLNGNILPLLEKYMSGERTIELYHKIMLIENKD